MQVEFLAPIVAVTAIVALRGWRSSQKARGLYRQAIKDLDDAIEEEKATLEGIVATRPVGGAGLLHLRPETESPRQVAAFKKEVPASAGRPKENLDVIIVSRGPSLSPEAEREETDLPLFAGHGV